MAPALSPIRYARSGDLHIAYRVTGTASEDLVIVPGFVSHLDVGPEEPTIARFYERLASFRRVITFDKRGTGLSDPTPGPATLEERMDDLRAVLDAAGSKHAAVLGISEGGPLAALFASSHPDRVSALIFFGSYARFIEAADCPGIPAAQFEKFLQTFDSWGEGRGLSAWAPSRATDPQLREWWKRFQRHAASPGRALALTRLYPEIDVRHALPAIRAPTLVLHRRDDRMVPAAMGRYMAERIPGARYVELPGADHFFWSGDTDRFADEIEVFLTGTHHAPEADRVLATVLFVDIVDSTAQAQRLGDAHWRDLLARHYEAARRQLARFRGREVDTAGDGLFATFDGPARGIRCAAAIRDAVAGLGIRVRAGLHTGECERLGEKITGIAVNTGARVAAEAGPGEILVSSTVRDLVAGSGLAFDDLGPRALKGLAQKWRLFRVQG